MKGVGTSVYRFLLLFAFSQLDNVVFDEFFFVKFVWASFFYAKPSITGP